MQVCQGDEIGIKSHGNRSREGFSEWGACPLLCQLGDEDQIGIVGLSFYFDPLSDLRVVQPHNRFVAMIATHPCFDPVSINSRDRSLHGVFPSVFRGLLSFASLSKQA